jgi:hypothetical protein
MSSISVSLLNVCSGAAVWMAALVSVSATTDWPRISQAKPVWSKRLSR